MKSPSNAQARSAPNLQKALEGVACSEGLAAAIRAGDVAVIDFAAAPVQVETAAPAAPASRPKPR